MAAGLFGLGWCLFVIGPASLKPTNVAWLLRGDLAMHFLGWSFFRREPWTFPLGSYVGLIHPVGGVAANNDALPWLAVGFKLISPLLPTDFQYVGLWVAACFVVQGIIGVWIVRRFSPDPWVASLGGMFFAMAPVLLLRVGHATLCAQWLLLWMIGLNLARPIAAADRRRVLLVSFLLAIVSAGVHPYLAAMVLALVTALAVRLCRCDVVLPARLGAIFVVGTIVSVAGVFVVFGTLGPTMGRAAWGFGYYSADLLALVNPMYTSSVVPALSMRPHQYEGFAYLGTGMLLVTGVAVVTIGRSRVARSSRAAYVPLIVASVLLWLYSLSDTITALGRPILDLRPVYGPLHSVWSMFRASGRFIWPLYYLLMAVALGVIARYLSRRTAVAVLLTALLVQVGDQTSFGGFPQRLNAVRPLQDPAWDLARGDYRHLVLYPPQIHGVAACARLGMYADADHYVRFAYWAYRTGLTVNSGNLTRPKMGPLSRYCQELEAQLTRGTIAEDTVYVVSAEAIETLRGKNVICGRLDGHDVCVSATNATRLSHRLQRG